MRKTELTKKPAGVGGQVFSKHPALSYGKGCGIKVYQLSK